MKLIRAAAALALALPAAPALAGDSAPPARPEAKDKKICKMQTMPGIIARRKRVCYTASDWEQQRRDSQEWGRERIDGCRVRSGDPAEPGSAAVTC